MRYNMIGRTCSSRVEDQEYVLAPMGKNAEEVHKEAMVDP